MDKMKELEVKDLPVYQAPEVLTYTDQEILDELGPAQASYGKTSYLVG